MLNQPGTTSKGGRKSLWVFLLLLPAGAFATWRLNAHFAYRAFVAEGAAFRDLGGLAKEMIDERADGVVLKSTGRPYIESFAAFHRYVARKKPQWVAGSSAGNPFPTLLKGARYTTLEGTATTAEAVLLSGEQAHHRPMGYVRRRLMASGNVLDLIQEHLTDEQNQLQPGTGSTGMTDWHNDRDPVVKAMPFLKGVIACQWTTAVISRSETLPAPGQQLLSGYVVLEEDGVQELLDQYSWHDATTEITIALPTGHSPPGGKVLESHELVRKLPTLSTYHQGSLHLAPDSGILYFELRKN